ncbi:MAG: SLC13 family permease [Kofleriaceae bacterium]
MPPLPYLLALATASNIGGVVSFSGNPQNMIVGAAAAGEPSFAQYLIMTLPVGVACLAVDAALLVWLFRRQLPPGPLVERSPRRPAIDRVLATKGVLALVAFAVMAIAGVDLAGASMTAATGLVLLARVPPRPVLAAVDWPLLAFFAGLFVVVAGLAQPGCSPTPSVRWPPCSGAATPSASSPSSPWSSSAPTWCRTCRWCSSR